MDRTVVSKLAESVLVGTATGGAERRRGTIVDDVVPSGLRAATRGAGDQTGATATTNGDWTTGGAKWSGDPVRDGSGGAAKDASGSTADGGEPGADDDDDDVVDCTIRLRGLR